jgi:predicted regulator of Ras-like GTPase activity (Roadblock/LC7/MglB family)
MASRLPSHPTTVTLNAATSRALRQTLRDYQTCAEASYVALLDESGSQLMEQGELSPDQSAIVGALANGAFIAVRELASRLGDEHCEGLYHQGKTRHFYIAPLSPVTFLLTVFGNDSKLGIIRSALAKFAPRLRETLDEVTLATVIPTDTAPTAEEGDLVLTSSQIAPPPLMVDFAKLMQAAAPTAPSGTL